MRTLLAMAGAVLLGAVVGMVTLGGHFQGALDRETDRADRLGHELGTCRQGLAMARDKLDQCEARCPTLRD